MVAVYSLVGLLGGGTEPSPLTITADQRRAIAAINLAPFVGPGVAPDASLRERWRKAVAYGYFFGNVVELGVPIEVDLALFVTKVGTVGIAISEEIDAALAFPVAKALAITLATETDAAIALTPLHTQLVGVTTESDLSATMSRLKARPIATTFEVDAAFSLVGGLGQTGHGFIVNLGGMMTR